MTDSNFDTILDESISALQAGVPLEEILAETPEYASELRPLLRAATLLADPDPDLVPEAQKSALRQEYMRQVATLPQISHPSPNERVKSLWRAIKRRLTPQAIANDLITVGITILLTLGMIAFILTYLSQDAIPGDRLYGIKRYSEETRLSLTFDPAAEAALEQTFNQRRLAELDQLLQQNRPAVIEFRGILETRGENLWVIEGHPVLILDGASIRGDPQEGDSVRVTGLVRTNRVLVAEMIAPVP